MLFNITYFSTMIFNLLWSETIFQAVLEASSDGVEDVVFEKTIF
jgi:hypothetical protein